MKTIATIEHHKDVVSDIVTVQETGKVSLVKIMHALGIPNDRWKHTTLQITAYVLKSEDSP